MIRTFNSLREIREVTRVLDLQKLAAFNSLREIPLGSNPSSVSALVHLSTLFARFSLTSGASRRARLLFQLSSRDSPTPFRVTSPYDRYTFNSLREILRRGGSGADQGEDSFQLSSRDSLLQRGWIIEETPAFNSLREIHEGELLRVRELGPRFQLSSRDSLRSFQHKDRDVAKPFNSLREIRA